MMGSTRQPQMCLIVHDKILFGGQAIVVEYIYDMCTFVYIVLTSVNCLVIILYYECVVCVYLQLKP